METLAKLAAAEDSQLFRPGIDNTSTEKILERYKELALDPDTFVFPSGITNDQRAKFLKLESQARDAINRALENTLIESAEKRVTEELLAFIGSVSVSPTDLIVFFDLMGKRAQDIPSFYKSAGEAELLALYDKATRISEEYALQDLEWFADYVNALADVYDIMQRFHNMRETHPAMYESMSRGAGTLEDDIRDVIARSKEISLYKEWFGSLRATGFPESAADRWATRVARGEIAPEDEDELAEKLFEQHTDPDTGERYNESEGEELDEEDLIDRALEFFQREEQSVDELKPLGQQKAQTAIENIVRDKLRERAEFLFSDEIRKGDEDARVYVVLHSPNEQEWWLARKRGYSAPVELSDELSDWKRAWDEIERGDFLRKTDEDPREYRRVGIRNEASEEFASVKPGIPVFTEITPELPEYYVARQGNRRTFASIEILGPVDSEQNEDEIADFVEGYEFIGELPIEQFVVPEEEEEEEDEDDESSTQTSSSSSTTSEKRTRVKKKQRFPAIIYGLLSESWPEGFEDYVRVVDPEFTGTNTQLLRDRMAEFRSSPLKWYGEHGYEMRTADLENVARLVFWNLDKAPRESLLRRFRNQNTSFGFYRSTDAPSGTLFYFHKPILGNEARRFAKGEFVQSVTIPPSGIEKAKLDKMLEDGFEQEEIDRWKAFKTSRGYELFLKELES